MDLTVNQRVGNIRTNKVGTIVSEQFRGANGEFRGHVIKISEGILEIWDVTATAALPAGF
jgi:hypothetical protein